ncbi:MAG: hypothetical protein EP343_09040 [Deltaproteobacteria bacterium]|nr:MAG: hypothetical protein EP343_09040 [Deltaproteobacteria bacterium]
MTGQLRPACGHNGGTMTNFKRNQPPQPSQHQSQAQPESTGTERTLYPVKVGSRRCGRLALHWAESEEDAKASVEDAIRSGELLPFCVRIESATRIGYARIWAHTIEEATSAAKHAMRPGYQLISVWLDR